jgi:hypothetical protein
MKENDANIIAQTKSDDSLENHRYSIFPAKIIDSMDELLKFRNAISIVQELLWEALKPRKRYLIYSCYAVGGRGKKTG